MEASASPGARRKHAGGDPRVHGDERVHVEDAHQVRIPLHAEPLAEQGERHRIERATDFDVPIGVDRPLARGEERKGGAGEGLQRRLLDLDEVRPHLAAGRAVNAQARDGAIPVPQKRILRVEAVKRASLERVAFDVAAAALLLPVFLRRARLRRQRREAPVLREREIDLVTVRIEEARAHDRGFEIVVANDQRDATRDRERRAHAAAGTSRASDPRRLLRSRGASGPSVIRKTHGRRHSPVPASSVGAPRKKSTWPSAPGAQ